MIHGIRTIVKTEGLAGIYQGLIPTMLRQGGNSAIRFTVFGNCQKVWQDILGKKDVGIIRSFISGAGNYNFVITWLSNL